MINLKYLDFDLLLERSENRYKSRVLSSPAGEAAVDFSLPFSELELHDFVLKMSAPRQRGGKNAVEVFGRRLFEAIFKDEMRVCFFRSLDEAKRKEAGLRLRLRMTEAPELSDVPWEYLYNPILKRFLSLSERTPIVRYLELPERIELMLVKPPIRILVMISSPCDYPQLDVEREWALLTKALRELERDGVVILERLENATLPSLQRRLKQEEYHIFHFIGHGLFDEQNQDGALILEDEIKRGQKVSSRCLGTLLHDESTLRLAIVNACEGARNSHANSFAGVAQNFLQQGIQAVITMRCKVTDETAITFTQEFYNGLADGYPVDAALAEARKAIFTRGNELEWGTPVLYMRSPDGRIFDFQTDSNTTTFKRKLDSAPAPLAISRQNVHQDSLLMHAPTRIFNPAMQRILKLQWWKKLLVLSFMLAPISLMVYKSPAPMWFLSGKRIYPVWRSDSEALPLLKTDRQRLDDAINDLALYLEVELDKKGKDLLHNSWTTSQIVVGLVGRKPIDIDDISAFLKDQMEQGTNCWREYNITECHIGNTAWVLFSLAQLNQAASEAQLHFLLDNQKTPGWWSIYPADDNPENASTYATAISLLVLSEHWRRNLVGSEIKDKVRKALSNGRAWLNYTQVEGKARWMDYPFSPEKKESLSLSGLVLHTLHCLEPLPNPDLDRLWLRTLPATIPQAIDFEATGHRVSIGPQNWQADNVRSYILPWLIIATVDAYPNGNWFERANALARMEQVLEEIHELKKQTFAVPWIAAEFLISLRYLNGENANAPRPIN